MSPYSSPLMFITRKNSNLKKIISDFSYFNSRLQRVSLAFSLIKAAFAIFEGSKCEFLSVFDFPKATEISRKTFLRPTSNSDSPL